MRGSSFVPPLCPWISLQRQKEDLRVTPKQPAEDVVVQVFVRRQTDASIFNIQYSMFNVQCSMFDVHVFGGANLLPSHPHHPRLKKHPGSSERFDEILNLAMCAQIEKYQALGLRKKDKAQFQPAPALIDISSQPANARTRVGMRNPP
jgi:hypothetical protein